MHVAVITLILTLIGFGLYAARLTRLLRSERAEHQFVESVFNRVGDPLFVKDRGHRLVLVNDAECLLAGRPRAGLLGRTDYEFFPNDQVAVFWRQDDLVFETGQVNVNEEVITDCHGVLRTIVTKKTLHRSPDGKPYVIGIIFDITDRKRYEEEVRSLNEELERLRAEWSAVVAHDLRQPLGAISLNAQLLARAVDEPALRKPIEHIRGAADRLHRMVGDIMDLARLDAHRLELVRQRVDVAAVARDCVERMRLGEPGRRFDVCCRDDVPLADADPDRIAQVIENLLSNAVKYGDARTPIVLDVARADPEVTVAVTNEGKPISAADQSLLFRRFQRVASAKLEGIAGTGLGLYITRALVEAHGGHITVESTPAGVTTFRFTLPQSTAGRV